MKPFSNSQIFVSHIAREIVLIETGGDREQDGNVMNRLLCLLAQGERGWEREREGVAGVTLIANCLS